MANVTSKAWTNDETNEWMRHLRYIQLFKCVSNSYIHSICDSIDDTEDIPQKLRQFIVFTLITLFAIIQLSEW